MKPLGSGTSLQVTLRLCIAATAFAQGCNSFYNPRDYYSEVSAPCSYVRPGGFPGIAETALLFSNALKPECKTALEEIIPYDNTWDLAPPGLKDEVTEAFQVLLSYPVAFPPENRIMGVAPGTIALTDLQIFAPNTFGPSIGVGVSGPRPEAARVENRTFFNWVLNSFDVISYQNIPSGSDSAVYTLTEHGLRRMFVYSAFAAWDPAIPEDAYWNYPMKQAATLLHEAHHVEGNPHVPCPNGTWTCDPQFGGAYGISIAYLSMLLHGSIGQTLDGQPILSNDDIVRLNGTVCDVTEARLLRRPPELDALVANYNECATLDAAVVAERWQLTSQYVFARGLGGSTVVTAAGRATPAHFACDH